LKGQRVSNEEYEVVAYPRLNHVQANVVQVVNRNTHVHRTMEIGLVLEGDGLMRVNDNSFSVHKGSLYFFNAGEPHEIIAVSPEGLKIAYQMVASSFCGEYLSCFRNLEILKNDLSTYLSPAQAYELTSLLVAFMRSYMADDSDTYGLRCICSICQLYGKLLEYVPYRQMTESAYLFRNKKMARLSRITEYIDTNYSEKITLEELANRENVTKTYLSHFIHDNLNMTFQEYVSSVRFERALKLIRSTSMCLTDISVVCGFSDVKYLSKMLEKRFGKPARKCCSQLCQEAEHPAKEEAQTFPTVQTGMDWLAAFWDAYIERNKDII
jgi:AraC-like DNA-binding protein